MLHLALALLAAPSPAQAPRDTLPLPLRIIDRPTTLPRGIVRLDAFGIAQASSGAPTTWTAVLGGGVGVTDRLEVGGQLVPLELASGAVRYVPPSLYGTFAVTAGRWSFGPQVQLVLPVRDTDPFFVDIGVPATYTIGPNVTLAIAPTLSWDARADGAGTTVSVPMTLQGQVAPRLAWEVFTGVGFSRFDPRFHLARRSEAFRFDDVTVSSGVQLQYTLTRRPTPTRPLADLSLELLLPQMYTGGTGGQGWTARDWTLQLSSSWYRF